MKRIKQLIGKGIDNLDEAEKAELMELLSPDKLAELTESELAEIKALVAESAEAMLDDEDSSDATLIALEDLANVLDAVTADEQRRAAVKADADAKKQALRDRIKGQTEGEGDDEDADAPTPEGDDNDGDDGDNGGGDGPAPEVEVEVTVPTSQEPVVVTASNTVPAAPRRSPVQQRGPVQARPVNRRQAAITAAANVPGVTAGAKLDTNEKLFNAFDNAVRLAQGSDGVLNLPVLSLHSQIPDELMLNRDSVGNTQKIEKRTEAALTASGGACAPVPYNYDLPTVGDDTRPVRDQALNRFGATRGGASFFTPPTITDVSGTSGATNQAVSEWTYETDVTPNGATKPYLRIDCGSDTPTITRLNAIIESYEAGNMMERWYPERMQAFTKLIGVWHARFAEAKALAGIAALSKAVNHGQILGSATDIFLALDQLIVGIRYRHRIVSALPIRVVGFEWVRKSIIADLVRRGAGDRPLEERLKMANEEVDGFFRSHNVNITWSPDFQWGRTIGQAGGPVAGTQGIGAVVGYPSVARFYVYIDGAMLFLDGGEFRAGVMRDVQKLRTNDWVFFTESFENVAYHGVPGEAYVYDIDVCANGGYTSALDIAVCASNS